MPKQFYRFVTNEAGSSELYLEGVIASESWYDDEVSPKQFREQLDKVSGSITVRINSPGGDVFAGMQIYNMLKDRDGDVTVIVDALAASAASFIAMAGDKIVMNTGSMMMIHKASTIAWGNEDEMQEVIEMLRKTDDSIVSVYAARTGKSKEEIKQLLADETWMTADEAVEMGFADEAMAGKTSLSNAVKNALGFSQEVQNAAMQPVMSLTKKLKNETEVAEATENPTEDEVVEESEVEATAVDTETHEDETTNVETEEEVVTDESEETESEEVTETTDEGNNESVEEKEMTEIDETAAAEVVAVATPKQEVKNEARITKNEARKLIVDALSAKFNGDEKAFKEINDKVKTLEVRNEIDGTTGAPLFAPEILATDIRTQYEIVGRVGSLVNRIDVEGAETYRQVVETAGVGFRPVALGAVKPEDAPVWDSVVFEPFEWALIVAWLDGVAKRSPFAVYQQIVRYVALELARLEDKIILTYAGGSVGSETRPATGLVPLLLTANRDTEVASYESENVIPAIGLAYGEIESDLNITLVANRRTWAQLATSLDGFGRPIFTVVGEQVAAGALGTFNLVQSNVLEDGDVVIGAFADYNLVTRGGLGTLLSREATVGDLNLFTQDASALRADIDITGGPVFVESFYLLQFPTES